MKLTEFTPSSRLAVLLLLLALSACSTSHPPVSVEQMDPEAATGLTDKSLVTGEKHMVVAANPHAAKAGFEVLERGGTAADAAVAVQATLTLVEPQSSGIGGGAFILYWDANTRQLLTYDAREVAPAAATGELFFENGKAVSWREAIVGGRSVGVPGVLRGLDHLHREHGSLEWSSLFESSALLAENGFSVSPRMAKLVGMRFHPGLYQMEPAASYFYPDGESIAEGTLLKNPQLADSLRMIATRGAAYFYEGPLAQRIVSAATGSTLNPGVLSMEDMRSYRVREKAPLCRYYKTVNLCGMDQPSSGGLAVLQMFGMLEPFDMASYPVGSAQYVHLFTQASRLAFADRNRYSADSDFVSVPATYLLDHSYLQERSALIDKSTDMGKAVAGQPVAEVTWADDDSFELPSTSHISIVDQYGNALSMTTSIEMAFGSSVMVGGFLLNNQLTDFSLSPVLDGVPVANRVQPGKRPRSSMSPFMVFDDDGDVRLLLGSPGGSRIIDYVARVMFAVLDGNMHVQEAIEQPNFTNRNDYTAVEKGLASPGLVTALEARGHTVRVVDLNSGVHAIEVHDNRLVGGADPRREGQVLAR